MPYRFKPAAHYLLVRVSDGHVLGRVLRGVYQASDSEPCNLAPYTGIVERTEGSLRIRLRAGGYLVIEGPEPAEGERLQLRQIPRPAGERHLDDPDVYRAWRDLAVYMGEQALPGHDLLRLRVSAAPYDPCPACNDHYGFAEGCTICNGLGFVPEVVI
ncbi:hypothetical protein [Stutzerimonas nitrititolerans]|uniref:hypothetical protein n=1 Tax=Stutzerimonas nitrititolerans TaxID=2482751 RepID=UPI00148224EA|nr:hypothetical protein [Stutzerimonas nitrititolerans]NNT92959.1 hypothetical protein [Stutzerimonas nitrititolerans]